jgi:hypothetical protein
MIVLRPEPPAPIRRQCSVCDDEGVISNSAYSLYDLRRRTLTIASPVNEVVVSDEVAAALRDLQLLDTDCERLVFAIRTDNDRIICPPPRTTWKSCLGSSRPKPTTSPSRRLHGK